MLSFEIYFFRRFFELLESKEARDFNDTTMEMIISKKMIRIYWFDAIANYLINFFLLFVLQKLFRKLQEVQATGKLISFNTSLIIYGKQNYDENRNFGDNSIIFNKFMEK